MTPFKMEMTKSLTQIVFLLYQACKNIESAMDKFHEQRSLLKEAIMSVALKNYNNTKDMLQAVKEYIISKVVNFKCENFLPAAVSIRATVGIVFTELRMPSIRCRMM